ncbi:PaaI family thioesterase [Geomesophilobacter sediminis]|uniref:Hotdog fold thioesterase n=1 Tax=Geomesophilobacter sediminis TaxID=2798584 RepID=A0A8J7J2K3_9BACT|nr:PaaI family thioesterase [Geomesophilobacter sediminis]MBJ6724993.1 hotdog fold thioesterase [Geomesophilobacter sediminis]
MDEKIREAIFREVRQEPFAQALGIELVDLQDGFSAVEMTYVPERMNNLFARAHGGAIFGLIDEAFETVCQTIGRVTVALNVSVNYVATPEPGARLRAEARELTGTKRTASYDIRVTDDRGETIALCQALAYRTDKTLPFV